MRAALPVVPGVNPPALASSATCAASPCTVVPLRTATVTCDGSMLTAALLVVLALVPPVLRCRWLALVAVVLPSSPVSWTTA